MAIAARADRPVSYQAWNGIAATPLDFRLNAGKYGLTITATVFGTATLQRVISDGAGGQYVVPVSAALAANGNTVLELPAGWYRLALAGVTGLSGLIEQIAPGRMGG